MDENPPLPIEFQTLVIRVRAALSEVVPAGQPSSSAESKALMLSSRTNGGRTLPEYYLVYFLLVDLLGYKDLGQWEKVAWIVPVRYRGRLYSIEHRKFGVGIFAPNHDASARMSVPPTEEAEIDATAISKAIRKAVKIAGPYFEWRAAQAAITSQLNVLNSSNELFERYQHFREKFTQLSKKAERNKNKWKSDQVKLNDGTVITTQKSLSFTIRREAKWTAQAAIDAFFSWTEHAFIHLAILQGRIKTGSEVAALADADWKAKFKAVLDHTDVITQKHYQTLLDLRAQIRNFMAHGAFGKRGEAFRFHSGAGAVPVLITQEQRHKYSLTGNPAFDEAGALSEIEKFLEHIWTGPLAPAKIYIFSDLPTILTYAKDGTYTDAMKTPEDMEGLVEHLSWRFDNSANMDW